MKLINFLAGRIYRLRRDDASRQDDAAGFQMDSNLDSAAFGRRTNGWNVAERDGGQSRKTAGKLLSWFKFMGGIRRFMGFFQINIVRVNSPSDFFFVLERQIPHRVTMEEDMQ